MMLRVLLIGALLTLPMDDATAEAPSATRIAGQIDALLRQSWESEGVTPAEPASDAEFLRRAYLDLVGTIPPAGVVREFLASKETDKRQAVIDRLLESPQHATHLANTWRRILLPDGFPAERSDDAAGMQQWLRDRFATNVRYDRIVGDFLTATGSAETGPVLYYQALELKPEKLAASTARSFLGIQIQCAQCHDHPFDEWKQTDFWEYAAYFAQVDGQQAMGGADFQLQDNSFGEVTLPEQDEPISPSFPGSGESTDEESGSRRLQLSIWLSSGSNPYLATATANRVWSLLFGRGIVEPVDDISQLNEPSHPELLKLLANFFIESGYDLKQLFRAVALTEAYQLSSAAGAATPNDSFATMAIKNLTAEQIFDSLVQCLQGNPQFAQAGLATNSLLNPVRREFLIKMAAETHRPLDYGAGLQQTLHMMNSPGLAEILGDTENGLLVALAAPFLTDEDRLETVFISALGRMPSDSERSLFSEHLADPGNDKESRNLALSDMTWALINGAEFRLNH